MSDANDSSPGRKSGWPRWLPVGRGQLALWHRPRLRAIPHLGCDRVVTALSEREGAREIGDAVGRASMAWTWIPLDSGHPPTGRASVRAQRNLHEVSKYLDRPHSMLLHCSAGMHRTGMLTLAMLIGRGLSRDRALVWIEKMRRHAAQGLRAEHWAWAHEYMLFAAALDEADRTREAEATAEGQAQAQDGEEADR